MTDLMHDDEMQSVLDKLQDPSTDDLATLQSALEDYPNDPRLHFLHASTSVSAGKLVEAHRAFKRSVELAPDFHIARFQFGFFQLTSGESDNALETWAPLDVLPKDHYLKQFVVGLRHLIRDEFSETIAALRAGIDANEENPPLNNDMMKIIEQVEPLVETNATGEAADEDQGSLTSLLLQQSSTRLH